MGRSSPLQRTGFEVRYVVIVVGMLLLMTRIVTLGFFDDIYIPRDYLPTPSALYVLSFLIVVYTDMQNSDTNEQAFFWLPPNHWPSGNSVVARPMLDSHDSVCRRPSFNHATSRYGRYHSSLSGPERTYPYPSRTRRVLR